jgi:hypothetical protein
LCWSWGECGVSLFAAKGTGEMKKRTVTVRSVAVLFALYGSLLAQSTTVFINDSNGNQTTGTISNGNVYFHDSKGNSAYGTIRNGNVFVNTDKGEITFGTIKGGNVFLTDPKGVTTGTIQNGNIFLSNSDGSITTGSYDKNGNVFTSTTPSAQQQQQTLEQRQLRQQQAYEAGAAVGRDIGNDIAAGIANHRINSFCKSNPTATYLTSDGINIDCPNAPFTSWEQAQIDAYCADNPGRGIGFGKHMTTCITPPSSPNLKWATWALKQWGWDFMHQGNKDVSAAALTSDQLRTNWEYWREKYCALAPSGASYKDLNGKKQSCN